MTTTGTGPERAVAAGGPLDGTELGDGSADEYEVRTADGSVHVYVRTERTRRHARVFDWVGRR